MLSEKYKNFLDLVVYQVYPRSFLDTNGDGIGDLPGIIEKLDYLRDLGINCIWISPCFKSPNCDYGYDISDYCDIMDEFGTLADMDRLITEAHKRGIKILLDLVANHTSTEHRWFQESRKSKDNPYSDYYYWSDEPLHGWTSVFQGSAWQYDELRGQYYLHSFAIGQADLNWENPKVIKKMQSVVDFWVHKGVDGFRCDVIDLISKDVPNGIFGSGPRLHEYIQALFNRPGLEHLFIVGECDVWDNMTEYQKRCGDGRGELTTLFQFSHLDGGRAGKYTPAPEKNMKIPRDALVKTEQATYPLDLLPSLFTDNHDQSRYISRLGGDGDKRYEVATALATLYYTFRGVPFIYQGQEFGTTGAHYDDMEDFADVESINRVQFNADGRSKQELLEMLNFGGRDNSRRPMAWDDSPHGGFTTGIPWIASHNRYSEINLKADLDSNKSVFRFYQALLAVRRSHPALRYGACSFHFTPEDNFFVVSRTYEGEKVVAVVNFEVETPILVPVYDGKMLLSNGGGRDTASGVYKPYEIAIYQDYEVSK